MSQTVMELDKEWKVLISQAVKLGLSKVEVKNFLNGDFDLWKEKLNLVNKDTH